MPGSIPSSDSAISEKQIHSDTAASFERDGFNEERTKSLLRKLDRNIVPFLALLYLYDYPVYLDGARLKWLITVYYRLSFLDRTNIGNARLAGLEKSLKMEGLDYNVRGTHHTLY